jgi:hypothetical protein
VSVLLAAAAAAGLAAAAACRLRPGIFLGSHGMWALKQAEEFLRHRPARAAGADAPEVEGLAPIGDGRSK